MPLVEGSGLDNPYCPAKKALYVLENHRFDVFAARSKNLYQSYQPFDPTFPIEDCGSRIWLECKVLDGRFDTGESF